MSQEITKEELLAKAKKPAEEAMKLYPFDRGKMQTIPKCCIRDFNDFAIWYTPGIAEPCWAIKADRERVYELANTDEMCIAAAYELAKCAEDRCVDEDNIAPTMGEWEVFIREAVAVGLEAIEHRVAR